MYESFWRLDSKPFEHSLDHRWYYPGESPQGALLKLRYAIENRRAAALLAGPSGVGKTLLVQMLRKQLGDSYAPLVHLVFPQMPVNELLAHLAVELGAASPEAATPSIDASVRGIRQTLEENTRQGRHAVVVIDEAHLLGEARSLEALRLLSNFETGGRPNLTLLLVGQAAILPAIDRMPGLEERLAVKCLLRAFTLEETISYVSHRLTTAGAKRAIFEPQALEALHHLTHGIARRINRVCDLALLVGFAEERESIGAEQLESISEELVTVSPE